MFSLVGACFALLTCGLADAAPLVVETFTIDPIATGRAQVVGSAARFSYQPGGLVAHYDAGKATAHLSWPLGKTLTQDTSFDLEAVFTIKSAAFFAKVNDFAQLSFGFINSKTTGVNRTGGNAYDHLGVDYFPNSATVPSWNVPALGPVTIQSNNGTNYFGRIAFPFGAEAGLKAEGALPHDTQLTAALDYDAGSKKLTLTMSKAGSPLNINSAGDLGEFGGLDGDAATIELFLPLDAVFAVDRLAIPLWAVTAAGGGGGSVVIADVLFDSFRVEMAALVPGDANGDGLVNGGDYTVWADHYLLTNQTVVTGDFTGDGIVDAGDYTVWADHFDAGPASAASGSSAVPEPGTLVLALASLVIVGATGARLSIIELRPKPRVEHPTSTVVI